MKEEEKTTSSSFAQRGRFSHPFVCVDDPTAGTPHWVCVYNPIASNHSIHHNASPSEAILRNRESITRLSPPLFPCNRVLITRLPSPLLRVPLTIMSLTLRHIPASSLYVSRPTWWLESRFHFSFAEYYNPKRNEFGNLRVVNDDLVQPHSGFGTHPHRDMEIFTYVVDGELTHKDSMGAHETLGRGGVQYMSAGLGITHSEMNNGDNLLRFLQIWIKPDQKGYKPNYGSRVFKKADRHNKLHHVVSSYKRYKSAEKDEGVGIIPIHQDANIFISELDAGFSQEYILQRRRQLYVVCIEGALRVNRNVEMEARDALEVEGDANKDLPLELMATGKEGGHFILLEMAKM